MDVSSVFDYDSDVKVRVQWLDSGLVVADDDDNDMQLEVRRECLFDCPKRERSMNWSNFGSSFGDASHPEPRLTIKTVKLSPKLGWPFKVISGVSKICTVSSPPSA